MNPFELAILQGKAIERALQDAQIMASYDCYRVARVLVNCGILIVAILALVVLA